MFLGRCWTAKQDSFHNFLSDKFSIRFKHLYFALSTMRIKYWVKTLNFHELTVTHKNVILRQVVVNRGSSFCMTLLLLSLTVALWHSNTQQCLQTAHSVHLESLCCWRSLSWYWTCSLVNLCSMCFQHFRFQSTPVLSLQAVWSRLSSSH